MDLKNLFSQGESETLEFKKPIGESKEIIKTISAFANTKGTYFNYTQKLKEPKG